MTEQEYRNHPAVNKSTLWAMKRSPLHYRYLLDAPRRDTPAFRFGRLVHAVVLTPVGLDDEYVIAPNTDKRTKAGREVWAQFEAENVGKTIITEDEFDKAILMANAIKSSPLCMSLLDGTEREKPLFWTDEAFGVECKCRTDAIKPGVIIDFKTCEDASTDGFMRESLRYGYDLQAAMYLEAARLNNYGPCDWYFIAQEKSEPFAVNVILAGDAFVERGNMLFQSLLGKYVKCLDNGVWHGYVEDEPNELILPEWATFPD